MNEILTQATDFVAQFEGFSPIVYKDIRNTDTFGYGSLVKYYPNQTFPISEADAKNILKLDLIRCLSCVTENVTRDINENQVVALIDFVYNLGCGALISSTLLLMLNSNAPFDHLSNQFLRWNKAGGNEIAGLTKRRIAERELFLTT